ncbi:MAG: FAD-binding oxidoreductase [Flavobacteriales bacterium]|nr:FAD-binding oxidoreductase [Flavobacteriales bacterium]
MNDSKANISFWDLNRTVSCDALVIGAGFSGLRIALLLKKERHNWNIVVVDRLPIGAAASTRNAGFACFGSPSEILADLRTLGPDRCRNLLERRIRGVNRLRAEMHAARLEPGEFGGYEVFFADHPEFQEHVYDQLDRVNDLLSDMLPASGTYAEVAIDKFQMRFSPSALYTASEFQLNPADLHMYYTRTAEDAGVQILRGIDVRDFTEENAGWSVGTSEGVIRCKRVVYCGNGGNLSADMNPPVDPARGQILITNELDALQWRGNFHICEGYYYFRNFGKRVLLGGARHLDKPGEQTDDLGQSQHIQNHLEHVLKQLLLPNKSYLVERRWSGTMGFRRDASKEVVVDAPARNFWSLYGYGGMGVALHTEATETLLNRILND